MTIQFVKCGRACMVLSSVVLLSLPLYCEEFPQAATAARTSLKQGFTQAAVPLLVRSSSISAEAVRANLIEQLCTQPCSSAVRTDSEDAIRDTGPNWSLQVSKDGSAGQVEYQDVLNRSHLRTKPLNQRVTQSELELKGRAMIQSKLQSVIHLHSNEQLVPLATSYRVEGGQNTQTGERTEGIAANRIIFGRTIDGVPVVGGGSRIIVTFANDGSLESLRYDWPHYTFATSQTVVGKSEIFSRLERVLGARTHPSTMKFAIAMPSSNASYPLALTPDMKLQKLECGYYDAGLPARDASAPVQTGCTYHVVMQGPNGMRRGFAGAVPAGAAFEADAKWSELQIVQASRQSGTSKIPGTSKQP